MSVARSSTITCREGNRDLLKSRSARTFLLYDDNQISSVRLMTTREKPLSVEEVTAEVKRFSHGINFDATDHIEKWRRKCEMRKSMAMAGFGGEEWIDGVRIKGAFLTTLQPLDKFPAVLAFEIQWKYLGSGPLGGDRWGVVNVSPPGYDWDISSKAWSKRIREGKAGNRTTNIPRERLGYTIPENLSNVEKLNAQPLKKELQEPQLKEKSQPGKNNHLVWVLGGLLILGLGMYGIRNRSSS